MTVNGDGVGNAPIELEVRIRTRPTSEDSVILFIWFTHNNYYRENCSSVKFSPLKALYI